MKRFMSNGTKARRVSRRVRRAARELMPRVARALLVLVLVLSTAMSTGLVYAAVGDTGQQTTPVTGDGTQGGDGATTVVTPQEPTTPDPSTTPEPTTPDSTTPSQTTTPATGGASDEGTTPAPETETPGTPATPEAETKTERTAPRAWEGDTDALELASEGLTFAADEAAASALQVALDEDPDAPLAQLIGSALADGVPATLNLTLSLDPTASTSLDGTLYASIIAGDTVTVPLPEGVTAEEGATVDVWQRAEDGTATSTRIGTARVQGGSIVVEFQAPVDTATGTSYAVGEVAEGSETPVLATLEASVDLGVRVDASAFGEEASQVSWTLQTGADGTVRRPRSPSPPRRTSPRPSASPCPRTRARTARRSSPAPRA